ncbi:hypothetical protein EDB95_4244 [Dinghuibacter silviterrae]|uniref:Uncharacterized protein n=1 Tax=Dinghuibacter silviterrae TaxID=1539049 RepID=A0A4R8DFM7_9BACT|nr:hypothetical protein EDB95_4244 [Dinghuibacter silviterrae]
MNNNLGKKLTPKELLNIRGGNACLSGNSSCTVEPLRCCPGLVCNGTTCVKA